MAVSEDTFSQTTLRLMQEPDVVRKFAYVIGKYSRRDVTEFHQSEIDFEILVTELESEGYIDNKDPDRAQFVRAALSYLIDARHA